MCITIREDNDLVRVVSSENWAMSIAVSVAFGVRTLFLYENSVKCRKTHTLSYHCHAIRSTCTLFVVDPRFINLSLGALCIINLKYEYEVSLSRMLNDILILDQQ